MDLLSSTKKIIFMLIESPSIYWFQLAFYYLRATEEALSPYLSFPTQSMFVKVADCVQLLFPPSERLMPISDSIIKSFLSFIQLTLKVRW